jgi:hypothetical protein
LAAEIVQQAAAKHIRAALQMAAPGPQGVEHELALRIR